MFREVRRQNRILEDQERISELIKGSEYGFLSIGTTENGYSYGIPINYVFDEENNTLYFHCAVEGQKLDILKNQKKVSFCIVGKTQPLPDKFSTIYESVIIFGMADTDMDDDEKRKALRMLVRKYAAGYEDSGETYINKSWERTFTFKVKIEHITAKARY